MLCFIHIERAGGTTMHHIFRNNFLSFLTLTPSLWSNEPGATLTAAELHGLLRALPFTRGFGGHSTRVYAGYERASRQPIDYITFLRSPVSRYISHFHYQVNTMNIPWTVESFLAEPRFGNFMTIRIAGAPDVGRAKELLRSQFSFVGLTERFDESLLLLRDSLNLPTLDVRYELQNVGRSGETRTIGDLGRPEVVEEIRSQNRLDLELYEFVRDELYPESLSRYGPNLGTDLQHFRLHNEGFRFSRSRRYAWALYRKLGYEPLGRLVRHWARRSPSAARWGQPQA
jgi:hypothetical protein